MQRIGSNGKEKAAQKNAKTQKAEKKKSSRGLWKWRGCGKRGKPKAGFPLFPQPLGNLAKPGRDSHIPTAPTTTPWKSGKPKAGFPLSHRDLLCSKTERKTRGLRPPRSASANDVYHSVTLSGEATRPGDLIVADHSSPGTSAKLLITRSSPSTTARSTPVARRAGNQRAAVATIMRMPITLDPGRNS
jgi:hypothetical protein